MAAVTAAAALGTVGAVAAQAQGPMNVRTLPAPAECRDGCPVVITLQGVVSAEAQRALRMQIEALKGRPAMVAINSPGGDVDAAMAMGRAVRAAGLAVAVARTTPAGGLATDGTICSSACTLILAGGVRRLAAPETRLGVHQMTRTETVRVLERTVRSTGENGQREVVSERVLSQRSRTLESAPEVANRGVAEHFQAMGIGPRFAELTLSTPHDRIRVLTPEERRDTGIVTQDTGLAETLGVAR